MSKIFTEKDLERIVELAGQALESEDRFICGCFERNSIYRKNKATPGITYFKNEGYYQRFVLRALLPSFPFLVKVEHKQFDIALFRGSNEPPVALGEMKLAMDAGFGAVPSIKSDIKKLSRQDCATSCLSLPRLRKVNSTLGLARCLQSWSAPKRSTMYIGLTRYTTRTAKARSSRMEYSHLLECF